MTSVSPGTLGMMFRNGANAEAHHRVMLRLREQKERDRREKEDDLRDEAADILDMAMSVISNEQAAQFQAQLNIHQTATVEALMENETALIAARERLALTLSKAHTLEDGRRVFKTEDGLQVFDENGNEVGDETISADAIDDRRPRWEQFLQERNSVLSLEEERRGLVEYQSELDEARERLDSGRMTQQEYDDYTERLFDQAPDAVRAKIGDDVEQGRKGPSDDTPDQQADLDLDADLANLPKPNFAVPGLTQ